MHKPGPYILVWEYEDRLGLLYNLSGLFIREYNVSKTGAVFGTTALFG